jgi:hypothetical protein
MPITEEDYRRDLLDIFKVRTFQAPRPFFTEPENVIFEQDMMAYIRACITHGISIEHSRYFFDLWARWCNSTKISTTPFRARNSMIAAEGYWVYMSHVDICNYLKDAAVFICSKMGYRNQTVITALRHALGESIQNSANNVNHQGVGWMDRFPEIDYFDEGSYLGRWFRNAEIVTRMTFSPRFSADDLNKLLRRARFAAYYMYVLGYSDMTSMIFYNRWCNLYYSNIDNLVHNRYTAIGHSWHGGVMHGGHVVTAEGNIDPRPRRVPFISSRRFTYWEIWEIVLFYIETRMYARLICDGSEREGHIKVGRYIHSTEEFHVGLSDYFDAKESPITYYKNHVGAERMTWDSFMKWIPITGNTLFIRRNKAII